MQKSKKEVRKEIFGRLKKQTEEERSRKSKLIKNKLFSSGEFKKANVVMFYVSLNTEVDTRRMIKEALESGKRVAVPYIERETKEMIASELKDADKDLEVGPYGIYQPKKEASFKGIPPEKIDLVIVPGAAFDERNNRLGRGKGYYDRFLKRLSPRTMTIGLCFDFQLINCLPKESHDFPVSKVISN